MDNCTDLLSFTYACIFMDNMKEEFSETQRLSFSELGILAICSLFADVVK